VPDIFGNRLTFVEIAVAYTRGRFMIDGVQIRGTFLDTLKKDAGLESNEELRTCMEDRGDWMIRTIGLGCGRSW